MALSNPRVGYITIRDALVSLLRTNVSTLNTNLTTSISSTTNQIKAGIPFSQPKPRGLYPMVLVAIDSKDEHYHTAGSLKYKDVNIDFRVFPLVKNRTSPMSAIDEATYLMENVEAVIRDNTSISAAVKWSGPTTADWIIEEVDRVYIAYIPLTISAYTLIT